MSVLLSLEHPEEIHMSVACFCVHLYMCWYVGSVGVAVRIHALRSLVAGAPHGSTRSATQDVLEFSGPYYSRFHLVGRYGKRSGMDDSQLRRAHHALALALARPDRRDRDRPREIERDGAWRESYPPYVAALLLRSYNKRAPEVVDVSSGEN
ncbi:jg4199 [Pararge aegeria aegeria]|uniref:Jg4199 protein n=1 Tax=Pararge aegeria aegeria TaxID=348720 RepID=A0A8S4R9U6_9NEOP|nr:jg4199 [Pararge aegeria aegeria]